jgi:hypothetical protein
VVTEDGPAADIAFLEDGEEVAYCRVHYRGGTVLEALDALARLHLEAGRRGWTMRLVALDGALAELIEQAGLGGTLGLSRPTPSDDPEARTRRTGPGPGSGASR